jgi:hypothetical protein
MKRSGSLLFFVLIISLSCNKDNQWNNSREEIITGNPNRMVITRYDSLVAGAYNVVSSIDLDIDQDQTPDFKLTSEVWGSPGMGQHPRAKILSLHPDAGLSGSWINDTTFRNVRVDTSYGEFFKPVYLYYVYTETCSRINAKDSVISVEPDRFILEYFSNGESITSSDAFTADTLTLTEEAGTGYNGTQWTRNDTICTSYFSFYHSCWALPNDQVRYIGIRLTKDNTETLGWIKLVMLNSYKLMVLETAIFK